VRARSRITRNDPQLALRLHEGARDLNPDDAKSWLAIGSAPGRTTLKFWAAFEHAR
jgi:hypothetical protein